MLNNILLVYIYIYIYIYIYFFFFFGGGERYVKREERKRLGVEMWKWTGRGWEVI